MEHAMDEGPQMSAESGALESGGVRRVGGGRGSSGRGQGGGKGNGGGRPTPARVYPEPVDRLIAELARLPGIGRRAAERLALHILKQDTADALGLAKAIQDVKTSIHHCEVCYNLSDGPVCAICAMQERDAGVVLVVEQPRDLIALEQTGAFKGVYHVLLGRLSPLDGVGPGEITAADLIERVRDAARNTRGVAVREVVLGLNPTIEGDGTGLYLTQEIRRVAPGVRVTRLARGLASGGTLEFSNKAVLSDAINERRGVE
jgi:recombination protein RecR